MAEKVRVEALEIAKNAEADRKAAEERWGAAQAARAEARRAKLAAAEEARLAKLDKLHALYMVTLHNDEHHTDRQAAEKLVSNHRSYCSWLYHCLDFDLARSTSDVCLLTVPGMAKT